MKMIAISLSSECLQEPRCSFCYQNKESISYSYYDLSNAINTMAKVFPAATLAFEYNGHNLGFILMHFTDYGKNPVTITTMPSVISKTFCEAVAKHGASAIALSYDSQKVKTVNEWLEKAMLIKEAGMKVSCNFLLENQQQPIVPLKILKHADQLNFLAFKPTGRVKNRRILEVIIEYCKGYLPVALDNCLGYQLGYTRNCSAGREFCHIRPDGRIVDCCFQSDCYLWLCKNAKRIIGMALEDKYHENSFEVNEYIRERR